MKLKKGMFLVCFVISVFFGCTGPYQTEDEEENNTGGVSYADELFGKEAELTEQGEQRVRFYTNDPAYWKKNGNSLWTIWDEGEDETLFTGRTVTMSKASGSSRAGYGLVLCQGQRMVDGTVMSTMLVVMINTNGEYSIGKVTGNLYEVMTWWTRHPALAPGAGPANTLHVQYASGTNEYALKINNSDQVVFFSDENAPIHDGHGKNGYVVIIAPEDRFPETYVDVRFSEKR